MYPTESLKQFSEASEFLNLNVKEDVLKIKAECKKLEHLKTYPSVVQENIDSKLEEIRGLNNELSIDIRSQSSELAQIKRRQALEFKYIELEKLESELLAMKEELVYARDIKLLAETKLLIYKRLLDKEPKED